MTSLLGSWSGVASPGKEKIWDYSVLCEGMGFEVIVDQVFGLPSSLEETLAWYRVPVFSAAGSGIGIPNAPQLVAYYVLGELLMWLHRRFPAQFQQVRWRLLIARKHRELR